MSFSVGWRKVSLRESIFIRHLLPPEFMALKSVLVVVSLLLSAAIRLVLGRGGVAKDSGKKRPLIGPSLDTLKISFRAAPERQAQRSFR